MESSERTSQPALGDPPLLGEVADPPTTTGQPTARQGADIDWSYYFSQPVADKVRSHWTAGVWRAFAPFIPAGSRVLEIGCATGRIVSTAVAAKGCAGTGIDISPEAIAYARRVADYLEASTEFVVGDGMDLPFADGSFDVVLSEGVIEHFTHEGTERMVREHVRVCRPGGRVLISVPNLFSLPLTYHKWRRGPNFVVYPERSYTWWQLSRLVARNGAMPFARSGFNASAAVEWFIPGNPRFLRVLDRLPARFQTAFGYETLVAAIRE
jgi:SAM-dependent methyltransferase